MTYPEQHSLTVSSTVRRYTYKSFIAHFALSQLSFLSDRRVLRRRVVVARSSIRPSVRPSASYINKCVLCACVCKYPRLACVPAAGRGRGLPPSLLSHPPSFSLSPPARLLLLLLHHRSEIITCSPPGAPLPLGERA